MSNDNPPQNRSLRDMVLMLAKNPAVQHAVTALLTALVTAVLAYFGFRVPTVPPVEPVVYGMGWHQDDAAADAFAATLEHPSFATTPAGKEDVPDVDVFLWKYTEAAWRKYTGPAKTDKPYPNVNQRSVGCCVGCGWKHGTDAILAIQQEADRKTTGWEPIAVEAIYAFSRVDIGQGRLGGSDGSNGSWAAAASKQCGNLLMRRYDAADLSVFDPLRARTWGARGVPSGLRDEAAAHKVRNVTKVNSWEDVRKAVAQRYVVTICSNVGFNEPGTPQGMVNPGTRDSEGFIHANGVWPHCMVVLGVQGGQRPGAYILNSWGDDAHKGPTGKGDPPRAGFWADPAAIEKITRQRGSECYAISGVNGFPARKAEWFAERSDPRDRNAAPAVYALAP